MNIYYILLSFETDRTLIEKQSSVFKNRHLIIVDNTQQSDKKMANMKLSCSAVLLSQKENTGYAKGMNKGMKAAWENDADWVVLLNDDLEYTEKTFLALEEILSKKIPGIYGPEAGTFDPKRWTTILNEKKSISSDTRKSSSGNQSRRTWEYISGSFLCIHKDVYKKTGNFNTEYFMYYEDAEYCLRAQKHGFPLEQISLPDLHHKENSDSGKRKNSKEFLLARNHLLFIRKHAPLDVRIYEYIRFPKSIVEFLLNRNMHGLFGYINGYWKTGQSHQQ